MSSELMRRYIDILNESATPAAVEVFAPANQPNRALPKVASMLQQAAKQTGLEEGVGGDSGSVLVSLLLAGMMAAPFVSEMNKENISYDQAAAEIMVSVETPTFDAAYQKFNKEMRAAAAQGQEFQDYYPVARALESALAQDMMAQRDQLEKNMAAFKAKHPNLSGESIRAADRAYYSKSSVMLSSSTDDMDNIQKRAQSYADQIKMNVDSDRSAAEYAATQQQFQKQVLQKRVDWAKKHPGVPYPGAAIN
jgi:hypothetical protein